VKEVIEELEQEYAGVELPEAYVEENKGDERTEAFAEFFQKMLDAEAIDGVDDYRFTMTYNLTWLDRLKALLFGQYKAEVGPLVAQGVGFGVSWQHYELLEWLRKYEVTSSGE